MIYMTKKMKIIAVNISFFLILMAPTTVFARGVVPCGGHDEPQCNICHLAVGIDKILEKLMGWIAIVAVVIIVVAGITYIVSAGNQGMITMAKTALKNTLIGVAIALSAFVLIHFVLKAIAVSTTGPLSGAQESQNTWNFSCN
jgi:hypothetical protein